MDNVFQHNKEKPQDDLLNRTRQLSLERAFARIRVTEERTLAARIELKRQAAEWGLTDFLPEIGCD